MRVTVLHVAIALVTFVVFAFATLNVSQGQNRPQMSEREDLERIQGLAVHAHLTTPIDDLPMYGAVDSLRTIRAWVNQDTDTLWEAMCEAEKEALGSKERYEEFLQTFEGEFAVKPTDYWAGSFQPFSGSTSMLIAGIACDSRKGKISSLSFSAGEQISVLPFHLSQIHDVTWPAIWVESRSTGISPGLAVDEMAFRRNEQGSAFIPIFQHRLERMKATVDRLEAFGIMRTEMCHPESRSYRDLIVAYERMIAHMLDEHDNE